MISAYFARSRKLKEWKSLLIDFVKDLNQLLMSIYQNQAHTSIPYIHELKCLRNKIIQILLGLSFSQSNATENYNMQTIPVLQVVSASETSLKDFLMPLG